MRKAPALVVVGLCLCVTGTLYAQTSEKTAKPQITKPPVVSDSSVATQHVVKKKPAKPLMPQLISETPMASTKQQPAAKQPVTPSEPAVIAAPVEPQLPSSLK